MRIQLLLFAGLRDAAGVPAMTLECPFGATVASVLADERLRPLRPFAPSLRFAVNEEFAGADVRLAEGDVLALLPPVSGG